MAKAKKKVVTKPVKTEKLPKITALAPFWSPNGIVALGQGADGRIYTWAGAEPAKWVLQQFTPPTAEEIAAHLEAQTRATNGAPAAPAAAAATEAALNRHQRRALKTVGEKPAATEAFE